MDYLSLYELATSLHVNFEKSKLIALKQTDWHAIFWPREILDSQAVVRHPGYPIRWTVTRKQQLKWVFDKLHDKLHYWKIATWPLHVHLRIVQSIIMAYVRFCLPLLH